MQDFLTPPPEDAVETIQTVKYIDVDYSAMKTPATYAKAVTPELMQDAQLNCKLGFHYYDKEIKKKMPLQPFTFFVLEVYSGLTGAEMDAGSNEFNNFWSNRVRDTRAQPYTLYVNGSKTEFSGLWSDIYDKVVAKYKGVRNARCLIAYCLELDALVEIPLTATAERGVKKAIANSQKAKKIDWKKVSLYNLAENDHIWGFRLKGFEKENEKGEAYAGTGDLFFAPDFDCGILQPIGDAAGLHAKCVEFQSEIRAIYAKRGERIKQAQEKEALPSDTANFPKEEIGRDYEDATPEFEPLPF